MNTKNTNSFIRKSLYSALVFFGTIMILSIGYATWNSTMGKVSVGNPLSASGWNALVDNIGDLDSRWSRNGLAIVYTGGNVGIGTASPGAKLEIFNNQDSSTQLFLNNTSAAGMSGDPGITMKSRNSNYAIFANDESNRLIFWDNTTGGSKMVLDGNGNLGIGTTTPVTPLHVRGGLNANLLTYISPSYGAGIKISSVNDANTASQEMEFAATKYFFSNGNMGIGTASPIGPLDVRATTNQHVIVLPNSNGNDTSSVSIASINDGNTAYQPLTFQGSRFNFINGNMGIGTTAPSTALEVIGNITAHTDAGGQAFRAFGRSSDNYTWAPLTFTNNGASYMGGMGWSPSGATLSVGGSLVNAMTWFPTGNATLLGTLTQNSDIRLKKDITPIENALDKISKLNGVNYYWKDPVRDSKLQIGVIAQEVEKVFPEAVETDNKDTKSVAYGNLIAPLIEAVKELKSQKDTEILELKKENEILKARIDALEQK